MKTFHSIILIFLFNSCRQNVLQDNVFINTIPVRSFDSLSSPAKRNFNDIIKKYKKDSCQFSSFQINSLKHEFNDVKEIGDLNGDKIPDSVFVLPAFCEDGQSYYFTDTTLPRLLVESDCCHPDNMFAMGDIDEDGTQEICIFYSTCVSHYKSLIAYSLKGSDWTQIGRVTFDIYFENSPKEQRIRKTAKGKFEMLEIAEDEKKQQWISFSF